MKFDYYGLLPIKDRGAGHFTLKVTKKAGEHILLDRIAMYPEGYTLKKIGPIPDHEELIFYSIRDLNPFCVQRLLFTTSPFMHPYAVGEDSTTDDCYLLVEGTNSTIEIFVLKDKPGQVAQLLQLMIDGHLNEAMDAIREEVA